MPDRDGVVALAGVDWWYHNRGHSECQIMRRLGAELPVLWVNSIGMRVPIPGKTELPFRRYARKLKSTFNGLRRDDSGMWVLSPLFIPLYSDRALRINGRLLKVQVKRALRKMGVSNPAVWITVPTAADAVSAGAGPVVFNRSDEFSAFPDVDRELIARLEQRLLSTSDHVLYVNHGLMDRERHLANRPEFLDHGVDFEHFATGLDRAEPEALKGLPRPIIGFYGALDEYTIDLDLLVGVARDNPEATVVVIGPQQMEIGRLVNEENVSYLGPVPYEDLPAYAARFDVGLMPWLDNDWIKRCNPIKLKEYLAAGFPVVTTEFPELAPYRDLVRVGVGVDEFAAQVRAALKDSDAGLHERRERVRSSGWDSVADRVAELLKVR